MIAFSKEFASILRTCLENRLYFASFRLPFANRQVTYIQTKPHVTEISDLSALQGSSGFIFSPFESGKDFRTLIIQPDIIIDGQEVLIDPADLPVYSVTEQKKEYFSTSFNDYASSAGIILDAIGIGKLQKVVLSKLTVIEKDSTFNIVHFYEKLLNIYPEAFVYLVNLPGSGTWLAATPELLLRTSNGTGYTMAVAGTKVVDTIADWDVKDFEEQEYVSAYIEDLLVQHKLVFYKSPRYNIQAANLFHLCNDFAFKIPPGFNSGRLLSELHPTPAVCGLPKQESKELITCVETHKREYYSGFSGPLNFQGEMAVFVNLRCMKVTHQQLIFFTGGGYTNKSEIQKEWEEANNKVHTLYNVIKKYLIFDT